MATSTDEIVAYAPTGMVTSHSSVRHRTGRYTPSTNKVSSFSVYGRKPDWGWDYAFIFAVDEAFEEEYGSPRSSSSEVIVSVDDAEEGANAGVLEEPMTVLESSKRRIEVLSRLKSAGFVFSQLYIRTEKVIIVRFSLPLETMKRKAELLGMDLQLKERFGGGYLHFSNSRAACYINDDLEQSTGSYFCPSDRILITLRTLHSKEDWGCDLNVEKMVYNEELQQAFAIHSPPEQNALVRSAVWSRLWDPTWTPPFRAMKDYLGARVALYFAFVSFYAGKLFSIALISIPVFFALMYIPSDRVKDIVQWVFAIAIVLWTTYVLESWKRRNASLVLDWGLNNYHADATEDTRPQFKGDRRFGFYCPGGFVPLDDLIDSTSRSNGKQIHGSEQEETEALRRANNVRVSNLPRNSLENLQETSRNRFISTLVTFIFICTVAGLTFLLLHFRNKIVCIGMGFDAAQCSCYYSTKCELRETLLPKMFATALPGILNGVLITVFDAIWKLVSLALTKRENHRTVQMFEDSLVVKRFAFQFISNYLSLFYLAFIKKYTSNPCRLRKNSLTNLQEQDCIGELESQVISLVLTKATIQQIMEIGVPFITSTIKKWTARWRARLETRSPDTAESALRTTSGASRYLQESKLPPYHSTIEDYAELVIQFGYFVLFGVAFPLAAVVNLVNNLIETRTDAFKILRLSQRVNADDAADIGAWYPILEGLNVLAVATNAALLVFTADTGNNLFMGGRRLPSVYQVLMFFTMWHVLLAVKAVAAFAISDTPKATKRKVARQQYDIARFFNIGWKDSFRGNSLLVVDEKEVELCNKYADLFDSASDDDSDSDDASSH